MLYGSEGDDVGLGGEGFGAGGYYIDVRQCKGTDDFAKKGGFLVIRFDEGQGDVRRPDFDRKAREAGAGTDVEDGAWVVCGCAGVSGRGRPIHTSCVGKKVAGEKKRFSEMAGHDLVGVADRGEVDAGIPAE